MAKNLHSTLGAEKVIRELRKWTTIEVASANKDEEGVSYASMGKASLWTETKDGRINVRVASPFGTDRWEIGTASPNDITPNTEVLFRVKDTRTLHSKNDHVALAHDRDVDVTVYTLVSVSGAKGKKPKIAFLSPVNATDNEGKTVVRYEKVSRPVSMNASCRVIESDNDVALDSKMATALKEFYVDFYRYYGNGEENSRYLHRSSSDRTKVDISTAMDVYEPLKKVHVGSRWYEYNVPQNEHAEFKAIVDKYLADELGVNPTKNALRKWRVS